MNTARQRTASVVLPAHRPLALPRRLSREEIERLSPCDYAIHLAAVRARQRLSRQGRRKDPMDSVRPSGGYQTITLP